MRQVSVGSATTRAKSASARQPDAPSQRRSGVRRRRAGAASCRWDHLDSGLDKDWLCEDWQDAVDPDSTVEVEDCRWTPCYDCGVCPQMDTEIQIGPTGKKLLPLSVV